MKLKNELNVMLILKVLFCLFVAMIVGNIGIVAMGTGIGIPAIVVALLLFIILLILCCSSVQNVPGTK